MVLLGHFSCWSTTRATRGDASFAFPFEAEEEEEEEVAHFLSVRAKAGENSVLVRPGLLSPSTKTPPRAMITEAILAVAAARKGLKKKTTTTTTTTTSTSKEKKE